MTPGFPPHPLLLEAAPTFGVAPPVPVALDTASNGLFVCPNETPLLLSAQAPLLGEQIGLSVAAAD